MTQTYEFLSFLAIFAVEKHLNQLIIMGLLSSLFGEKKPDDNRTPQEKQDQKNFDILKYDGIRARNMGRLDYAIRCFEQAIDLNDEPETLGLLAHAYLQANRTDDARLTLDRLVRQNPSDFHALLSLAGVCYMQEDYATMKEVCQKAIAQDDKNAQAYFLAARAERGLKNDLNAIVMLTKALAQNETFTQAYQLRAEVLWDMRQAHEATDDLNHILSLNPDDEDALLLKGRIEAATGHADEAETCFNRILEVNPFNETAYLLKGEILCGLKKAEEAEALYTEAIDLMPDKAVFYQERGRVRLLNGNKEGAAEDMKKAIEIAPEKEGQITGNFSNFGKDGIQTGIY